MAVEVPDRMAEAANHKNEEPSTNRCTVVPPDVSPLTHVILTLGSTGS